MNVEKLQNHLVLHLLIPGNAPDKLQQLDILPFRLADSETILHTSLVFCAKVNIFMQIYVITE